jgi:putative exosortase-associated protein (TIGR04073 family)
MCKTFSILAACVVAALLSGCASAERKFGQGMSNILEPVRMGEMRRSVEQTALFDTPDAGYSTGLVRGFNKTLARAGVGIYQVVTAPFPPYEQPFPNYLAAGPVYPDSYKPTLVEGSTFATDTNLGFSGGDVHPLSPGSRFRIFDTH